MNKIKHGEFYECQKCEGLGYVPPKKEPKFPCWRSTHYAYCKECVCTECWGAGQFDWIENIVGKSEPENGSYGRGSGNSRSIEPEEFEERYYTFSESCSISIPYSED